MVDRRSPLFSINIDEAYEGTTVYPTLVGVAQCMETILKTIAEKEVKYGSAWREQGWMGNLARIMSKTSRLKNMLWKDDPEDDSEEPVYDTALDLAALSLFFYINYVNRNKWGKDQW